MGMRIQLVYQHRNQRKRILQESAVGKVKYVGETKKKECGRSSQCPVYILLDLIRQVF